MKTLLLALVFGVWTVTLVWHPSSTGRPQPRLIPAPTRTPQATTANPSRDMHPTPSTPTRYTHPWEAFQAEDHPAFVQLLRAAGCPEDSVRLFAVAAVGRPIQKRLEEPMIQEVRTSSWWRNPAFEARRALPQASRRARAELDAALVPLIGDTAESLRQEHLGVVGSQTSWLTGPRRAQLTTLRSRHASELEEVRSRAFPGTLLAGLTDELRSELRTLRQRQEEEVLALLGPADFTEYAMRESPEAQFVRYQLPEARDETEFCRMVQAARDAGVEPFDARNATLRQHIPKDALPADAPDPREQVLNRFRETSSPEDIAAFERERAAEAERAEAEAAASREERALRDLQSLAQNAGFTLDPEEARNLKAALDRRGAELEKEWGPLPANPTEAESKAFEDRAARELEAVAVSQIGDRGHALVEAMRRREAKAR